MNQGQLLRDLTLTYDDVGLQKLSTSLQVNYDFLPGLTIQDKARALIAYLERRERLPDLVEALIVERPSLKVRYQAPKEDVPPEPTDNLSWLEELTLGGGTALEELPTLKWSSDAEPETIIAAPDPIEKDQLFAEEPTLKWADPSQTPISQLQIPPYDTSQPVTDSQMFFGRQQERQDIYKRLLNLDSTAIIGLRHIGKSSLLRFISFHEFWPSDQPYLFAYLDLQEDVYHTEMGLLNGILQQWERALNILVQNASKRPYPHIGDLLTPTLNDIDDFAQRAQALSMTGYRLVICLDEFEQLLKRPSEFGDDLFQRLDNLV